MAKKDEVNQGVIEEPKVDSKTDKPLQFVTQGDKKVYELDSTEHLILGERKYNVRLVTDHKDGSYTVLHSVYADKGTRFLGNVQTVLYDSSDKGRKLFKAEIDGAKGDRIIYDRNRQALSDSKNDFRSSEGRPVDPYKAIGKEIAEKAKGELTQAQIEAYRILGIDISKLKTA